MPFIIPESWQWVRLGFIGYWRSGSTPNRSCKDYFGGTIPWIKTGELTDGYITDSTEKITTKALEDCSLYVHKPGTVLIAMYGATIGKLAILDIESTTNQACCGCKPDWFVYNQYLFYFLMSHRSIFKNKGFGGAQDNISKEKIVDTLMPLPPLGEQHRICDAIHRHILLMRTHIDLIDRASIFLKKIQQSLLLNAIQGKLVPQDPDDSPVQIDCKNPIIRRDNSYYELKDHQETCIDRDIPFEIPESWRWVRACSISRVVGGGTPKTNITTYWGGDIPWITPADMDNNINSMTISCGSRNITQLGINESSACIVPTGSVIISSRAPVGYVKIASNPLSTNQGCKTIVPSNYYVSEYMYYALICLKSQIIKKSSGTTFLELSKKSAEQLLIPLPPYNEQLRIVDKLRLLFKIVNELA